MSNTTTSVLFAASLCTAIAAQDPARAALPHVDDASPAAGAAAAPARPSELLQLLQQQDPDYSPRGMFLEDHGDFMLRRERFNPMVEIGGGFLSDGGVSSESGSFDLYRLHADIDVPVTVAHNAFLNFGAFYHSRRYDTRNMVGFGDETLYAGGLRFGFGVFLDNDILLEAEVLPGSWSDWDGSLHHQDYDLPASVLATVRYSPELYLKVGARYNEVYEDANVLPWLGFSWATETVRFDMLLPESLELSLWPTPDVGILFGAEVEGAEYRVRSGSATGRVQRDIRVQEVQLYTGAIWRMNDFTSLQARAGAAVAGDYKVDDGDVSPRRITGSLEPAFFFDVSFGIDF